MRSHVLFVLIGVPRCFECNDDEVSIDNLSKVELWIVGFIEEFGQTCDRGQFGGQTCIVEHLIDHEPYLWHDATLEEFMLIGRHGVVTVVTVLADDKVGPVFVHVFDMYLVMSGYGSHIQ